MDYRPIEVDNILAAAAWIASNDHALGYFDYNICVLELSTII